MEVERRGEGDLELQIHAWKTCLGMGSEDGSFLQENVSDWVASSSVMSAALDMLWQKVKDSSQLWKQGFEKGFLHSSVG